MVEQGQAERPRVPQGPVVKMAYEVTPEEIQRSLGWGNKTETCRDGTFLIDYHPGIRIKFKARTEVPAYPNYISTGFMFWKDLENTAVILEEGGVSFVRPIQESSFGKTVDSLTIVPEKGLGYYSSVWVESLERVNTDMAKALLRAAELATQALQHAGS